MLVSCIGKTLRTHAAGQKVSEIDPEGKTTSFTYDAVGNLASVKDPMGFVTRYAYDASNNRISQSDANGHTTAMAYDTLNRQTSRTYPNSDQERWGYDAEGNALYHVNGVGDSTVHTYNSMGRETHLSYAGGHQVSITYNPDGKQDSVTDYRGLTKYTYDSRGRLKKTLHPNGQFIENRYDRQGNRTHLITSFDTTRYAFDSLNRMDSVISGVGQVTRYFFTSVGNLDSLKLANGVGTKYTYDSLNRLKKLTQFKSTGALLASYTYTVNKAGIRTKVMEADSSTVNYGYDNSYRLVSEARTGTYPYSNAFTYDSVGNRKAQIKGSDTLHYTYNSRDQLLQVSGPSGDTGYVFDGAGRMTKKIAGSDTVQYAWVDEERMKSVHAFGLNVTYSYDADGRRVKDSTGATVNQYLVDAILPYGQVVAKSNGGGSHVAGYVYGMERISQALSGDTSFYLTDGQGSIRQLSNVSDSITDTYFYTGFGESLASTGTKSNDFRYVGEQLDGNSGLYNLRARWMNPTTGRFISVDPFKGKVGRPVSQHRYLYADQSPINRGDPTGRETLVSLQAGSAGSAALELGLGMAVRTAGASYWRWFLGQLVIGSVSTGYLAEMGWDAAKQREWLNEAKKETPIRLNHYANSEKKALIDVEPRHIRPNKSGFAFFTPDVYESSAEATNMLATPREQEWYISLNMYEKLDRLSPKSRVEGRWWDPPEAESHVWRDGGGWERTTPEIIILNKVRQPSPWQPLSD